MAEITLSSAVRNNLLSLQKTADLLSKTQERLSTGLKVNNALDDPTAYFTASALNTRANDLNRLLDSVGNALQTVIVADEGLTSITDLVESAQAIARQAIQASGPVTESKVTGSSDAAFNPEDPITDLAAITKDDTLSITIGDNSSLTVTFGDGVDQVDSLAELNDALSNLGGGSASVDSTTGAMTITATNSSDNITIAESAVGKAASFGLTAGTTEPTASPSSERAALETQFNNIRTQIDQLARDSSFNGTNLLQNDNLTVIFNEDATSSLGIKGVDADSDGLGINYVAADSFQSNDNINTSLDDLSSALDSIRSQASTFGSQLTTVEIRQEFTKQLINVLETGAGNLTLADTNLEGANVLALQTRQQLANVTLGLASQAEQQILRNF